MTKPRTDMQDFQDRGEALRQSLGIDGAAGDAQDVRHGYVQDAPRLCCLACGLGELATVHQPRTQAGNIDGGLRL